MVLPTQSEIGMPILKYLLNKKIVHYDKIEADLAIQFNLDNEEMEQTKTSGSEHLFHNRIRWSIFYMYKAGLIEKPKKGHAKISLVGKEILDKNPLKIDYSFLNTIPKFVEWENTRKR